MKKTILGLVMALFIVSGMSAISYADNPEIEVVVPHDGPHDYHRDLTYNDQVRFTDTMGYNYRRFLLDRDEYYIDLMWGKTWIERWFAIDNVWMTVRDEDFNTIKRMKMDNEGYFDLGGERINYEISEWRNSAFKKVIFELDED